MHFTGAQMHFIRMDQCPAQNSPKHQKGNAADHYQSQNYQTKRN